jgi:hypothetical protein
MTKSPKQRVNTSSVLILDSGYLKFDFWQSANRLLFSQGFAYEFWSNGLCLCAD